MYMFKCIYNGKFVIVTKKKKKEKGRRIIFPLNSCSFDISGIVILKKSTALFPNTRHFLVFGV